MSAGIQSSIRNYIKTAIYHRLEEGLPNGNATSRQVHHRPAGYPPFWHSRSLSGHAPDRASGSACIPSSCYLITLILLLLLLKVLQQLAALRYMSTPDARLDDNFANPFDDLCDYPLYYQVAHLLSYPLGDQGLAPTAALG
jgi:hypothetical protein